MPKNLPETWTLLSLRAPTLPPATHTNTALIGAARFVVVDPGSPYADQQAILLRAVVERLEAGALLEGIVLTHHHGDHTGGVEALRGSLAAHGLKGVPVMAHALAFESASSLKVPATDRHHLEHGDVISLGGSRLKVLHTPGHTRGHLALLDVPPAVLYGGDMVASKGTIIVNPPEGDMAAYLDSLAMLSRLDLRLLVPSHGAPIEEVEAHLSHYVEHRLKREALVLGALSDTLKRPDELLPGAYPEVPVKLYPLAQRSLLAHLIKLKDEGRAREVGGRWHRAEGGPGAEVSD